MEPGKYLEIGEGAGDGEGPEERRPSVRSDRHPPEERYRQRKGSEEELSGARGEGRRPHPLRQLVEHPHQLRHHLPSWLLHQHRHLVRGARRRGQRSIEGDRSVGPYSDDSPPGKMTTGNRTEANQERDPRSPSYGGVRRVAGRAVSEVAGDRHGRGRAALRLAWRRRRPPSSSRRRPPPF